MDPSTSPGTASAWLIIACIVSLAAAASCATIAVAAIAITVCVVLLCVLYIRARPNALSSAWSAVSSVGEQISHPEEYWDLVKYALKAKIAAQRSQTSLDDEEECFRLLGLTSRSFAAVIAALDKPLRTPVCVFYLVLRALDTVEDDMTVKDPRKRQLLRSFHERLADPKTCRHGIRGLGDHPEYVELIDNFDKVVRSYQEHCSGAQKDIIADITRDMGEGMASFVGVGALGSTKDYDSYCHVVAGLVGIGLSRLFECESPDQKPLTSERGLRLADSMGKFLQTTNITRDYAEDVAEGRPWWPFEFWGKYASSAAGLRTCPDNLLCLNEMIAYALQHAPHCVDYLQLVRDPNTFYFCALPQVMAIATLDKLYDNPDVFTREVKIRKGLALRIMRECKRGRDAAFDLFARFAESIAAKAGARGDSATQDRAVTLLTRIRDRQTGQEAPGTTAPGRIAPRQDSPRQDSPRQDSPRQDSPRQDSPRQDSPRHDSPRQDSPRQDSPRQDSPRQDSLCT